MLSFIAGRAGTGKTYHALRSAVNNASRYKMTYIIVPEQSTLSYEKQLIAYNAEARRLGVEVLSFTKVVEKVMLETGGLAGNYIDSLGKTALVYRAITDCADSLKLFGRYSDNPRFAEKIAETVDELKTNEVSTDALVSAANGNISSTLRDKLSDTALIVSEYERLVGGSYFDPVDKMTALVELLDSCDFFDETAVYFDGFNGFTPQEENVIDKIIIQSRDCIISLNAPTVELSEETFYPISTMAKRFIDYAVSNGIALGEPTILTENHKFNTESMLALEREIFTGKNELDAGEEIAVYSAVDTYEEMRFVASEIRKLIIEGKCRYRDIAVIASDIEAYRSATEIEFEQYEIPYFIDARRDVRFKPLMRLITFAFKAATRGMYYEDMADLAKTGLAGIDYEQTALLENYINLWHISGKKWEKDFTQNPKGFSDDKREKTADMLNKVNEAREKLAKPVLAFKAKLDNATTADEYAAAIYDYLEAANTAETIRAERTSALSLGEEYDADRMWELLMDVLDRISLAMGSEPMKTESYAELISLMFENADVGVIPPHADEVIVGSEGRARVEHIKYCFIVGANEGNFPRPFGEKGIFSNGDKEELLRNKISLIHDEETRRCELMLSVYNAFTIPSDGITLSYSASENGASLIVKELPKIFKRCRELNLNNTSLEDICSSVSATLDAGAAFFGAPRNTEEASVCEAMRKSAELSEKLESYRKIKDSADRPLESDAADFVAGKVNELSATKVDTYGHCAFKFFCRYGLSLYPEAEAKLDSLALGTFIHFLLEKSVAAVTKGEVSDVKAFAARLADEYILSNFGEVEDLPKSFLKSLSRTIELVVGLVEDIKRELDASGYIPVNFELEIGEKGVEPWRVLVGDGNRISFEGKVDRVDICERDGKTYLRIIDYKSNKKKKEFSLAKIYDGIDIQMLVYLIAISLADNSRIPAGVFYFPANRRIVEDNDDFEASLEKASALSGMMLEDSPSDGKTEHFVYTKGQLELLQKHIEKLFADIHRNLKNGIIPKKPSKDGSVKHCEYCDYAAICGVDTDEVEPREIGKMKDSEVFTKLEEEYGNE